MDAKRKKIAAAQATLQAYYEEIRAELQKPTSRQRFRRNIPLLLTLRSLTQAELGKKASYDTSHINRLTNEKCDNVLSALPSEGLLRIADALGVTPETLLGRDLGAELIQLL